MKYVSLTKKHSQLTDVSTPHALADMASAGLFKYVSSYTVESSPVTTVTFSGLDLDADDCYIILIDLCATANTCAFYVYLNGDTTASHYYHQRVAMDNNTVAASRNNNSAPSPVGIPVNDYGSIKLVLTKKTNWYPFLEWSEVSGTTSAIKTNYAYMTFNSATNVTSIAFTATVANTCGIGSHFTLYKGRIDD